KRAANILRAEEKKDGAKFDAPVKSDLLSEPTEHALHDAVNRAEPHLDAALEKEDFETAMTVLADLRAPTDAFFDSVMVNTDDSKVRANRLNLLAALRAAVHKVANFAKIEG
ncbi:MAG: DALR anticodon-binding domain-containing protein, partial [Pseudomonadota bacterium]